MTATTLSSSLPSSPSATPSTSPCPAPARTATRAPRLFDSAGNHFEQHGGTLHANLPSLPTEVAVPVCVYSRFGLGTKHATKVCVHAATGPFVVSLMLSPAAARELAAAITVAAERAELVQCAVEAKGRTTGAALGVAL
jgi:hypothetical protein